MGKIILVTGGSRSGKSAYALGIGQSLPWPRTFIATCPIVDNEMEARILAHQRERSTENWQTIEQQTDIGNTIKTVKESDTVLVDCLTLWINNIMYRADADTEDLSERDIEQLSNEVIRICRERKGVTIFVTNEVGMGIVPEDKQTRLYRDLVGRCNQVFAANADTVVFMVCSLANIIKGELEDVVA